MQTSEEMAKRIEERIEAEMHITCPHCKKVQDNDDCQYPVSYFGSEDGPEIWECDKCGEKFEVSEVVYRSYEVKKLGEE